MTTNLYIFILLFCSICCTSSRQYQSIPFQEQYILGRIERIEGPDTLNGKDNFMNSSPTPFSPGVTIFLNVLKEDTVTITYYDDHGKLVCEACREYLFPGQYKFVPEHLHLNQGIYFIKLNVGKERTVRKTLIL